MIGIIDFAKSRRVAGWVQLPLNNNDFKVVAFVGGQYYECSVFDRPDLKGAHRIGFEIRLDKDLRLQDFVSRGSYIRVLGVDGAVVGDLPLWRPLRLAGELVSLSPVERSKFVEYLPVEDVLDFYGEDFSLANVEAGSVSFGDISKDRVAIVGRGGHFFLFKGTNNVFDLYRTKSVNSLLCSSWYKTISDRVERSKQTGCKFLQIFVPEKSSLLREFVPYPVDGPTALWSGVVGKISSDFECSVVDLLDVFSKGLPKAALYRPGDTHFSSFGAFVGSKSIVSKLGLPCDIYEGGGVRFDFLRGDLASRFFGDKDSGSDFSEIFSNVSVNGEIVPDPLVVSCSNPESGNVGCRFFWKNQSPAYRMRVLCFGNSFFERGLKSNSMTWWFSRLFEEFYFVWSSDVDWRLVDEIKPDVVLCQTVERFLGRSPSF